MGVGVFLVTVEIEPIFMSFCNFMRWGCACNNALAMANGDVSSGGRVVNEKHSGFVH